MKKPPDNKKSKSLMIRNSTAEFLMFTADSRQDELEVRFQDETVWLTQKLMAELFQKDPRTINEHIQNIFAESELQPESVIRKFRITATDGKTILDDIRIISCCTRQENYYCGKEDRKWMIRIPANLKIHN